MDSCQICFEERETHGIPMYRFCGGCHVFCETCFLEWKKIHDDRREDTFCPICRTLVISYVPPISWKRSVSDGFHLQTYPDGKKWREYSILEGNLHGPYKAWSPSGEIFMETVYKKGLLHGPYHYWYANGKKKRLCHYEKGILHGPYVEWSESGRLMKECAYLRGALHGLFLEWYEAKEGGGIRARGFYQHGLLQGILKTWYSNGHMESERKLHEGTLITLRAWHFNGVRRFVYDEESGRHCEWDENDRYIKQCTIRQGLLEGYYVEWFANGQKRRECRYVDGRVTGVVETWYDDGRERSFDIYEKGKRLL